MAHEPLPGTGCCGFVCHGTSTVEPGAGTTAPSDHWYVQSPSASSAPSHAAQPSGTAATAAACLAGVLRIASPPPWLSHAAWDAAWLRPPRGTPPLHAMYKGGSAADGGDGGGASHAWLGSAAHTSTWLVQNVFLAD